MGFIYLLETWIKFKNYDIMSRLIEYSVKYNLFIKGARKLLEEEISMCESTTSFILTSRGRVTEISTNFEKLTSFSISDLQGKDMTSVFNLLRIKNLENQSRQIDGESLYIFTKQLQPRHVKVYTSSTHIDEEVVYYFQQIPDSQIDDKIGFYEQLLKENFFGLAVYSVPDFILIKANKQYINFLPEPYNEGLNSLGLSAKTIFKDYLHSKENEPFIKAAMEAKTICCEEVKFKRNKKETTYLNFIFIPIIEEGEVRFIVVQAIDVTKSVISRKLLEEQNSLIQTQNARLEAIFVNTHDMLIIMDTQGSIKKISNKTKELFGCKEIKDINELYAIGEFYDYRGNRLALEEMHCFKLGKQKSSEEYKYIFRKAECDTYLDICTTTIYDNEGNITSGVIVGHDITEPIKNFNEIRDKSKKIELQKKELEIIFDIAPIGLSIVDGNGNYIEINKKLKDILASNIVQSVGQSMPKCTYFNGNGKELLLSELPSSKVIKGEEVIDELVVMKVGDKETYHSISAVPMFNDEGEFYKGIIASIDITESIIKTKALEKKEAESRAIIENMTDGLFTIDTNNTIKLINSGAQALSSMSEKAFKIEDSFSKAVFYDMEGSPVSIDKMPGALVLKGDKLRNYRLTKVTQDGTVHLSYSGSPIYDENGNITKGVICARDISDLITYEEIIKQQRDNLYSIIDKIECPIARLSYPDLKVIQINHNIVEFLKKLTKLNGIDFDSLSKMSLYDFERYKSIEKSLKCIQQAAEVKSSIYLRNEKADIYGTEKYFNTIYQPVLGVNNEIAEMLIVMIDVTMEAEEKKEIEKVLQMQGEFFSFIAHEFRTPLTTMSASLQLLDLVYNKDMTPNIRKYINTIRRSTFQQLRLVNNLLDITRAEAGFLKIYRKNHEIVSVTRAILQSIKPFALDKDIKLRFKAAFNEKVIALDDEKYERILLNLLSNAIKFTPNGKSITVTLSSSEGKIFICVKDKGIGIPKEKQEYIFERFGQSDSRRSRGGEGTGIGLYLVKLLVQSMKGEITLLSSEDKGSSFIITLPEEVLSDEEFEVLPELTNNRLIQGMQLEFSNIYYENLD